MVQEDTESSRKDSLQKLTGEMSKPGVKDYLEVVEKSEETSKRVEKFTQKGEKAKRRVLSDHS